jgi:type II secretory pathway predicted ATPase ExeA
MNYDRYGLKEAPFGGRGHLVFAPVPSRLEPLEALEQALLDGQGIAVLTAAAGLGKSALCRELEHRLSAGWLVAVLPEAGYTTRRSLLQAILYELGLPYTGLTEQEARLRLLESIRDRGPTKSGLILIADEAQRLNDRLLEELRSLINHDEDGQPLIRLLLCGDLVLEERLIDPALSSLNQRVVCHETLLPLSHEESAQLIDYRITRAGGDGWEHVFTRTAMELLCLVCDGSPRNLEQLAKRSLQIADEHREPRISAEAVRQGLEELKELPLQWNEPSNLDAYTSVPESSDIEPSGTAARADGSGVLAEDLMFDDAGDDAISVVVGDELPSRGWETSSIYAIEVGGDVEDGLHTPSHDEAERAAALDPLFTRGGSAASHCLFEDSGTALEDTAILQRVPVDHGDRCIPAYSLERTTIREALAPVAMMAGDDHGSAIPFPGGQNGSGWLEELDVDDPYAVLDAGSPAPPVRVPSTPWMRSAGGGEDKGEEESRSCSATPTPVTQDFETQLLDDIRELNAEVAERLKAGRFADRAGERTAEPAEPAPAVEPSGRISGLGAVPEWDVVQPDWVTDQPFTPVEIDTSHRLELEPVHTTPETTEETRAEPAQRNPVPGTDVPPTEPAVAAKAAVVPVAAPAEISPLSEVTQGQRPYSQLFSRLRRLRSSFRQQHASGG